MAYVSSGCTATAVLETSVHGVVVHTSRSAPSSWALAGSDRVPAGTESSGNRTITDGSATVWYTSGWPISWSDSGVPHRGQ